MNIGKEKWKEIQKLQQQTRTQRDGRESTRTRGRNPGTGGVPEPGDATVDREDPAETD